jgi:hypothetical protein
LEGGPPGFPQGSTCLVVLRIPVQPARRSRYGALTPSGGAFQHLRVGQQAFALVLQPQMGRHRPPGLGSSRFARHYYGNLRLISSRRATEMFQFTRCPPTCLCVQQAVSRHHSGGVAPFGISGLIACMQLPLNVSPVSASFIGLQRRGIHRVLSLACSLTHMTVRCAVLRERAPHTCSPTRCAWVRPLAGQAQRVSRPLLRSCSRQN